MRYLLNNSTNPYFNMAFDEYALKHIHSDEDFFYLWRNEPSVIVGKNQNTVEEINQTFIDNNHIKVARRVSGGGAVYHDLGNLNFTFIVNVSDLGKVDFRKFVQPVIDALKDMGVQAQASSRNDILINDLKISGNAQRLANKKLMHHGTLLYDVNMDNLVQALHVDQNKYMSTGVKSVRSSVTNIKDHLPDNIDMDDFWNSLHFFLSNKGIDKEIILNEKEIAMIEFEALNRFSTWDWIYGKSPEFNVVNKKRFQGGSLEMKANVKYGQIESIRFMGDCLRLMDVSVIESRLKNMRFHREDIGHVLSEDDVKGLLGETTKAEILSLMFD